MRKSHGGQATNNPQVNNAPATMSNLGASTVPGAVLPATTSATTAPMPQSETSESDNGDLPDQDDASSQDVTMSEDDQSNDEDTSTDDDSVSCTHASAAPRASSSAPTDDEQGRRGDTYMEDTESEVGELLKSQEAEIASLRRQVEERDARIDFLEEMVAQMTRERVR